MTRRLLPPIAALLTLAALVAPETRATDEVRGWASAYSAGVMDGVIRYRLDTGLWWHEPPRDWYISDGAIATNNCRQVGLMMTLIDPGGREYRVLVADCGGGADGGSAWMTEHSIVAELDWRLWEMLTAEHGRPLEVALR